MGMSAYFKRLRSQVGHDLLLCPGVAAVIPDGQGRILFQERPDGEPWSLPAGSIEPGETPEAAIKREVEEETGLIVEPETILGVYGGLDFRYVYPSGDEIEFTVILFRCRVAGGSLTAGDNETKSLAYFSREDAPSLALPYPLKVLFSHVDAQP